MANINVDFSKTVEKMKPVHGIGQPPIIGRNTSLFTYLSDAGIPYSRLHDVGGLFGGNCFVDLPNIFRDFDADENEPSNYDFAYTDILINALIENGVEPYFRLGVTIEETEVIAYRVYPPKDFAKWARICEHIIMHYTKGWSNGYHHKITYWEIWNEPDNSPDSPDSIIHNHMWQGKREEYYEFYTVVSKHLKERFPDLKIGGYGSCGFYTLHDGEKHGSDIANSSPRYEYFIIFFEGFLDYIKKANAPLDFFSWHNYRGYKGVDVYANYVRETLDKYGYTEAESSCNEWCTNLRIGTQGDIATRIFIEILAYQNARVDNAMAYDGRCTGIDYAVLFNSETMRPRMSYYCFKDFNRLYKMKNQTEICSDDDRLFCISASDEKRGGVILINPTDASIPLNIICDAKINTCYITEEGMFDFDTQRMPKSISPKSFITVIFDL